MKRVYQILGLCLLMLASLQEVSAQSFGGPIKGASVVINGPTNVSAGNSANYTIIQSPGLNIYASNWTVIGGGGTVTSATNTTATIQWTTGGTHTLKYNVALSNSGVLQATKSVTVTFTFVSPSASLISDPDAKFLKLPPAYPSIVESVLLYLKSPFAGEPGL